MSIKQSPIRDAHTFSQALALHAQGQFALAERLCLQVLQENPGHFDARHLLAMLRLRHGRFAEALDLMRAVVKAQRNSAEAWINLGIVLHKLGRRDEALTRFRKALAIKPRDAVALYNRGLVLNELGRREEAIASYERALAVRPDHPETLYNRAKVLRDLARHAEAIEGYDQALALRPGYVDALYNRGNALAALGRHAEAIASYDRALALRPDHPEALHNRGNAFFALDDHAAALASYQAALAVKPDYVDALYSRGNALFALRRHAEALESYDRALTVRPDHARTLNNRGNALQRLERHAEALESYDRALAITPADAEVLVNRGNSLLALQRHVEALASYEEAWRIDPGHPYALSALANCALMMCDFTRTARLGSELEAHVATEQSIISPFTFLGYCGDPSLQLQCARTFTRHRVPRLPPPIWTGQVRRGERIRIAYLSADFREHPTAFLAAELFERHDRSRFEVAGISYGQDDKSEMRARLLAAFDQFHDVTSRADRDTAELLHDLRTDIAIDLQGFTYDVRSPILAHRPAPIQASYLGYPGTMGAPFIDYIIADPIVLPLDHEPHYSERIVHLPPCYQVNSQRPIAAVTPARAGAGLPENGFVLCCFNNNWKITPPVFNVWMRLLAAVDQSVLWLISDNASAEANLRAHARSRGIDPARLVFAARVNRDEHLARHRLADLFLDTLPYNAHTTASDALWAGLPVLTCAGSAFAGRVASSLLAAAGLPELITATLADYEALALRLAHDQPLLASFKHRLDREAVRAALFDAERFCLRIEAAYATMWELWQRGEAPRSFAVE
jgi:predicted O-linked N-acetylglucosamine transferase (SPINDLY family)